MTDLRPDALKEFQPERGGAFIVPAGKTFDDMLAAIQSPALWTMQLEEAECQIVLMGLHKLRLERPGWDYCVREIEVKLGGQMAWPEYPKTLCFRCRQEKPAAQLVTTGRCGQYCLDCLPGVEICRGCGCTDEVACPGGCSWAGKEMCSICAASAEGEML